MIWKIFKKYCKKLIIGIASILFLLVILNYVRSLIPLFISKTFEVVGEESQGNTLPYYLNKIFLNKETGKALILVMLCIMATAFVRDVLNAVTDILIANVGENISYNIQTDFFNRVQCLPYSYLNHCETGDLIQRSMNDVDRIKRLLGNQLPELLNNACKIVIYTTQVILISWKIGLVIAAFIPVVVIIAVIYFKKMNHIFVEYEEEEGKLSTVVQENLTGIRVVKAFANEDLEIKKEANQMNKFGKVWQKMMDNQSTYWASGDLISYSMMLVAFAYGLFLISKGECTLPNITAIILLVEMITDPTRQFGRLIGEFGRTDIAAKRIYEIVSMPSEFELADGTLKPEIKGNVEFKNVSYKFADSNMPTIKNVSFKVKEGETVALIGKTGCGKSTLVSLLNRMLETTSGDIFIDGVNIKDINKKHLRNNVGLVLQESFLFTSTIEENIAITNECATHADVKRAAEIAAVSDDIERFEKKYDTIVGEKGVTLSGGQKQRISIARTLLNKKPILVFDDSLSAVDTETDIKIRKALNDKTNKTTTFIITHRIATAKDADMIIVLDDGKIANIGTHEELIKQDGLYKNIWNIQSSLESEEK